MIKEANEKYKLKFQCVEQRGWVCVSWSCAVGSSCPDAGHCPNQMQRELPEGTHTLQLFSPR